MTDKPVNDATVSDLEKQVDALVKNIDDVLKAKVESPSDDDDMTGSGADNIKRWKGKGTDRKFTGQVGSPVRQMVGKRADDDAGDVTERLAKAAELLGLEPAELQLSMLALDKAKSKASDDGAFDDDEPDEEGMNASSPSKTNKGEVKKVEVQKAAAEGDVAVTDSVVIEGEVISKAEVGEGVFNVLKAQSEKIEKQAGDIKKAQDEAEMERLRKRADDEFEHVPGSTEERAQMLKAISALPKALQQSFTKVLLNSEKITKDAFSAIGTKGGKGTEEMQKTRRDFEAKVNEIAKRDSIPRNDAMSKARHEDPEGFKAYQGNGN